MCIMIKKIKHDILTNYENRKFYGIIKAEFLHFNC